MAEIQLAHELISRIIVKNIIIYIQGLHILFFKFITTKIISWSSIPSSALTTPCPLCILGMKNSEKILKVCHH